MNEDQNHIFPEPEDKKKPLDSHQYGQNFPPQALNQPSQVQDPYYSNSANQEQAQNQYQTTDGGYENESLYTNFDLDQQTEVQKTVNKDILSENLSKKAQTLKDKIVTLLTTKWWVTVSILVITALIGGIVFYFINRPPEYSSDAFLKVGGKIEAPSTSPSGSPDRWKIVIQNRESVPIKNIEVKLKFDKAFQYLKPINPDPATPTGELYKFDSLAGLGQGTSEVIIQFEGSLTGNIDENTIMSGTITYTPAPLSGTRNSTRTVSIAETTTRITAPQVKVTLTGTNDSVQNGSEIGIVGVFENLSEKDLKNIRITVDYPSGSNFVYTSSELVLKNTDTKTTPDDGRNIWNIPVLPRLQSSTLSIKGNLFGADGVRQAFRIEISSQAPDGSYKALAADIAEILVTSQPLIISTSIVGKDSARTFEPGETLTFSLNYENKSTTTIQNVELLAFIDDPANLLDYSTTNFFGGNIGTLNNGVIQWRGSGVPQLITLTPQVSGSVQYSIKVKSGDAFIASSLNQSGYTIRPRAQAKATNIQQFEVGGDLYQAKGAIEFSQKIEELPKDQTQQNKHQFKVNWEIRTRQSQVNDVKVETITTLPPTSWDQVSITPSENSSQLVYDPLNGKITWRPGNVIGYTGIANPVVTISFVLTVIVPSNSSLSAIDLYNELSLVGVDDFSGERYSQRYPKTKAT